MVDINLTGTMRVCAAARAKLKEARGTIVNTASVLSYLGGGLVPGYAASKGGITQLTKSLAIAYAPDGIRVNAVAPGWIETPLTEALRENAARSEAILARTPLGRWGKPEDIAGGVLYLSSPIASLRHRHGAGHRRRLSLGLTGTPALRLTFIRQRASCVNQTWRHGECGGFSGFPPQPTKRQTSLCPVHEARTSRARRAPLAQLHRFRNALGDADHRLHRQVIGGNARQARVSTANIS